MLARITQLHWLDFYKEATAVCCKRFSKDWAVTNHPTEAEKRKWPCRSCKQIGHSWAKCPQLNIINGIVSLIMSKQEQVNTENNLKKVSDTLLQLGLSPAALGINSQNGKADHPQTGAAAALAAALNQSLGVTANTSPSAPLHSTPSSSQCTPPTPAQPLLMTGGATNAAVPGDLRSLF